MRRLNRALDIVTLAVAFAAASGIAPRTLLADEPAPSIAAWPALPTAASSPAPLVQFRSEAAATAIGPARADVVPFRVAEELPADVMRPATTFDAGLVQPEQPMRELFPIDLPTALTLADADNPRVALAREQIREAYARVEAADVLWLPSINAGLNYNKHEGVIQDVRGDAFDTSRGAFYAGNGAGAVGAASPAIPGIWANFHLTDAIYLPLAARQFARAQSGAASAVTNDTLLQAAVAYLELLRAVQDLRIAEEIAADARELANLTVDYARTGQGLEGDADRAQTELSIRLIDIERAREAHIVASARLAEVLRLDPTIVLGPADAVAAPLDLVTADQLVGDLVAQGLSQRPELSQARSLAGQAIARLQRERHAPWIPSIVLGMSYGGFGAGTGGTIADFSDRMDFDAMAYWQIRNLGHGEQAARATAASQVRQAQIQQVVIMDRVAREVVEEHARVEARRRQIAVARQGVEFAVQSHRRNIDRIRGGAGLPIEVLQSIQALGQARRDYLRATIEFNTAQFGLYRALGWNVSRIAPEPVAAPSAN